MGVENSDALYEQRDEAFGEVYTDMFLEICDIIERSPSKAPKFARRICLMYGLVRSGYYRLMLDSSFDAIDSEGFIKTADEAHKWSAAIESAARLKDYSQLKALVEGDIVGCAKSEDKEINRCGEILLSLVNNIPD